jgi:hypothetical protein
MTEKDFFKRAYSERTGCGGPLYFAGMLLLLFLVSGCATKRSTESNIDVHSIELMTQKMDSMLHATSTWQQSIFQKQTALVDSFKQREVRDTSRTVFLDEEGKIIKETVVIKELVESDHSTKESEKEYWEERFRKTDSLLQVSLAKQEKMDSTLQLRQKDTVVEKKPTLGERLKWIGLGVILAVIGFFAIASAFMKKK